MAELTITAANVIPVTGYTYIDGVAGETVTRGMVVYLKAADSRYWKSQHDGTAAESTAVGVALNDAGAGQPIRIMTSGSLGLGAILTVGVVYCVGATAGSICVDADVGSADYKTIVGVASTTSNLVLKIYPSGVALA